MPRRPLPSVNAEDLNDGGHIARPALSINFSEVVPLPHGSHSSIHSSLIGVSQLVSSKLYSGGCGPGGFSRVTSQSLMNDSSSETPTSALLSTAERTKSVPVHRSAALQLQKPHSATLDVRSKKQKMMTVSVTIQRKHRTGRSETIHVRLDVPASEMMKPVSNVNSENKSASQNIEKRCSAKAGPHILLLTLLFIPFAWLYSIAMTFYIGTMCWFNMHVYLTEEKTFAHRLFLAPLLLISYPLLILLSMLCLPVYSALRQVSWYGTRWRREMQDLDKGFFAWLCTKLDVPQCSPYEVIYLEEDLTTAGEVSTPGSRIPTDDIITPASDAAESEKLIVKKEHEVKPMHGNTEQLKKINTAGILEEDDPLVQHVNRVTQVNPLEVRQTKTAEIKRLRTIYTSSQDTAAEQHRSRNRNEGCSKLVSQKIFEEVEEAIAQNAEFYDNYPYSEDSCEPVPRMDKYRVVKRKDLERLSRRAAAQSSSGRRNSSSSDKTEPLTSISSDSAPESNQTKLPSPVSNSGSAGNTVVDQGASGDVDLRKVAQSDRPLRFQSGSLAGAGDFVFVAPVPQKRKTILNRSSTAAGSASDSPVKTEKQSSEVDKEQGISERKDSEKSNKEMMTSEESRQAVIDEYFRGGEGSQRPGSDRQDLSADTSVKEDDVSVYDMEELDSTRL